MGDAVLELAVSEWLFHHYPDQPEGALSLWRSALVNTQSLGRIGYRYRLGHFLKMGRGEMLSGGRKKISLLANAVEALLGAVYLDGGYPVAYRVVHHLFSDALRNFQPGQWEKDYKSLLQERLQGAGLDRPAYRVTTVSGEPHARLFEMACTVPSSSDPDLPPLSAMGRGPSKRMAEQDAAKNVWTLLAQQHEASEHAEHAQSPASATRTAQQNPTFTSNPTE